MDQFMEQAVAYRRPRLQKALYALSSVLMVVFAGFGLYYLMLFIYGSAAEEAASSGALRFLVVGALYAALAVLWFFLRDLMYTEYDYTLTNAALDFARIYNNKKRKALGSLDLRHVEAAGPVASSSFQRLLATPGVRKINWFLNRDADLVYFSFQKDGRHSLLICEPNEEMLALIQKTLPRGVWQNG